MVDDGLNNGQLYVWWIGNGYACCPLACDQLDRLIVENGKTDDALVAYHLDAVFTSRFVMFSPESVSVQLGTAAT